MEKKTIGQFIAALRKANGLTQQEVADRLDVSNKAVSRWERDECAPDITVIPALAELLGVTCDELLKGERITGATQAEKSEPKVEKQVKALITRAISGFQNMIGVSLAISAVGLICMFGISYGFYRPVIGLAVMCLFEAVAVTIAVIAINKMRACKTDNELFENADQGLQDRYDNCLGSYSFLAFYAVFAVVLLSLPVGLIRSDIYLDSVLSIESYLQLYFVPIVLFLAVLYLKGKAPYITWITGRKEGLENKEVKGELQKMNRLQIGAVIGAGICFVLSPYVINHDHDGFYSILAIIGLLLLLGNVISFVYFVAKDKQGRRSLLLPGVRNLLFIPSGIFCQKIHEVSFFKQAGETIWHRYDDWNLQYLGLAICWAMLVTVVFCVIERLMKKSAESHA